MPVLLVKNELYVCMYDLWCETETWDVPLLKNLLFGIEEVFALRLLRSTVPQRLPSSSGVGRRRAAWCAALRILRQFSPSSAVKGRASCAKDLKWNSLKLVKFFASWETQQWNRYLFGSAMEKENKCKKIWIFAPKIHENFFLTCVQINLKMFLSYLNFRAKIIFQHWNFLIFTLKFVNFVMIS